MEAITEEFHVFLNSTLFQDAIKPVIMTVGSIFSLQGILFLVLSLRFIWDVYVVPLVDDAYNLRKEFGDYVIINNVTDILGTEFAKAFLLKGHSLVLIVAKDKEEAYNKISPDLEKCREEGKGEIVVIIKDTDKCDRHMFKEIKTQFNNATYRSKIGILLNNSGVIDLSPRNFANFTDEEVIDTAHTNVVDLIMMTKITLEIMKDNLRGLIVNVSIPENCSFFTDNAFPLSIRQFTDEFENILSKELVEYKQIKIEAIHPGGICIEGCHESKLHPTPAKFVNSAIKRLGRAKKSAGYFYHSLENFVESLIPKFLQRFAIAIRDKIEEKKSDKEENKPDGYEAL